MASEVKLAELIQTGYDLVSFKTFSVALTALSAYDYFLTLNDEVLYIWKMESVPVFVIFLFTRYLPVLFQVWMLTASFYLGYTPEICAKFAFIPIVYFSLIAALSQIVLTLRAYALTMKNRWVAGVLFTISTVELFLGSYMSIRAAVNPLPAMFTIPLVVFQVCSPNVQQAFEVVQMIFPLIFDITVFVLVVVQVKRFKSRYQGMNEPKILDTLNRDAEMYFAAITTCHFLTVVLYFTTRVTIQGIPVMGNMTLMPMMISRMIISLKKAAASPQVHMSLEVPTVSQIGNLQDTDSLHPPGSIQLSVFKR